MKNTLLPSEKAAARAEAQQKIEDARKIASTRLRGDMGMTFGTPEGIRVLRWLRGQCGYGETILGANPVSGEIDPQRTLYSAMRLNLYLEVRKNLPFNILKEVEYD